MPVGHMGPDEVETIDPDATVDEVVDRMASANVGSVVVTAEDRPVGIVTDRDVALAVGDSEDVGAEPVRSIMTEDPATLREDDPGTAISAAIDENGVRRIPVVDEDGELAGIVTLDDLVATVGEELGDVSETIERQSPAYSP